MGHNFFTMAKVQFTAIVSEVKGRLSGSVFQTSVGGNILRSLPLPRNPQTQLQQRNRSALVGATSSWRNCSAANRNSWPGTTMRDKFEAFTAFNYQYMWLTGTKYCTSFSPSAATMPNPDTGWATYTAGTLPAILGYFMSDQSFAGVHQWFIRVSTPRAHQSDTVGPLIAYRGAVELASEADQLLIEPTLMCYDFPENWADGKWVNWQLVINTGTTYGATAVMESQIT